MKGFFIEFIKNLIEFIGLIIAVIVGQYLGDYIKDKRK